MKNISKLATFLVLLTSVIRLDAQSKDNEKPIVTDQVIFEEKNGIVAVEAEFFYKQSKSEIRQWYLNSKGQVPVVEPDSDGEHISGSSFNAYIEILPDTRKNASEKLIDGENFSNDAGKLAVVHYKVKINNPGRYYVWVRSFSLGAEDNGLHVGFDGTWPEHGRRMQWCEGKGQWTWASKQRTLTQHCGVPKEIYLDIDKPGIHDIQFSLREDGFEFDKFIMTTDSSYIPEGVGPKVIPAVGKLPPPFPKVKASADAMIATAETANYFELITKTNKGNKAMKATTFPVEGTGFYLNNNWLAINPEQNKEAKTILPFQFEDGNYDIIFAGVGESDGKSTFSVLVNGKVIGDYATPLSVNSFEEGVTYNKLWENITLKKGDEITVIAKIGSTDGKEFSRGRWSGIIFAPAKKGKKVLEKAKPFSTKQNVNQ